MSVQGIQGNGIVAEIAKLKEDQEFYFQIGEHWYTRENITRIYDDNRPSSLKVKTLSGAATYLQNNIDEVTIEGVLIRVDSPFVVTVFSPVFGEKNDRHVILKADLDGIIDDFPFGRWMEQEDFIIKLSSLFKTNEDRQTLLDHVSFLSVKEQVDHEDDGSTKRVSGKFGVHVAGDAKIVTVPVLIPYRTFTEIEQPSSPFLFRYRANGKVVEVALFEADGGAWRYKAMESIRDFLAKEIPNARIVC